MSLKKLFNFKYLLQNIKKSKMAISLFFIIIPIFTSLMIIASGNEVFDFITLACINMVGMYIIPFIFSVCLFGFVFKKNSVDFMGSMPISRKCIFITNTIGGVVLIILLQVITFILTLLLGAITDCIIFPGMALDVLIYQTVAYVFVFTISNLAMSVSGNLLTQIVVTLLITFLIPFSSWYVNVTNSNNDYEIMDYGVSVLTVCKMENYTAPFLIADNGNYEFNEISIYKMLTLIVLYFAIGLLAFNKRKMEIAGESFCNKYVHFVVKGLTLAPFVAILIEIGDYTDFSVVAIILAIITIYYFIYDLITAKRMKFTENIVGLVFSVIALFGTYSLWISIDNGLHKKFDIDDIKTIEIERNDEFEFVINDKEKIKSIISLAGNNASNTYYSGKGKVRVYIEVSRYGGGKYYRWVYVPTDKLSELLEDSYSSISISDNALIDGKYFELSKDEEQMIKEKLNVALNGKTYKELFEIDSSNSSIYLYEYKDHELVRLSYPISISDDVAKCVIDAYNRYAYEYVKTGYRVYYYNIDFYGNVTDEIASKMNIALSYCDVSLLSEFIVNNYSTEIKDFEKCALIYSSDFRFYTDKIDELVKMLNEFYEENKEIIDEEYNNYYLPKDTEAIEIIY